jgi:hypothetical protein
MPDSSQRQGRHVGVNALTHRRERIERLAKVGEVSEDERHVLDGYGIAHQNVVVVGKQVGYAGAAQLAGTARDDGQKVRGPLVPG